MREGVLIYDHESDRMDIRFGLLDFYGGLHCGESFDASGSQYQQVHNITTRLRTAHSELFL